LNSKNRYLKLDYEKVNKDHIDLYNEHKLVNKELDTLSEELKTFEDDHQNCISEHDLSRKIKRAEVDAANRAKDKTRTEKHMELHDQKEKMLAEFQQHEAKLAEERAQIRFDVKEIMIKKKEEFDGKLGRKDEEILRLKMEVECLKKEKNLKVVTGVRSVSAPQRRLQEIQELLSADKLEDSYDNDTSGPLTDYDNSEPIHQNNQSDLFEPVNSQDESYYINSPALLRSRKTPKTAVFRKFIDNTLDETPCLPMLAEDLTRLSEEEEEASEDRSEVGSEQGSEAGSEVGDFEFVNENSFKNSSREDLKNESEEKKESFRLEIKKIK